LTELTRHEQELVDLFGKLFQLNARPENLGRIFALLSLKAASPENGLDQQQIAFLTGRSLSTVSRVLDKMVRLKYCNYEEDSTTSEEKQDNLSKRKYYPRRRYYIKASYKELTVDAVNQGIAEYSRMKRELEKIRAKVPNEEEDSNSDLLTLLDRLTEDFDQLVVAFRRMLELWPDASQSRDS